MRAESPPPGTRGRYLDQTGAKNEAGRRFRQRWPSTRTSPADAGDLKAEPH